MKWMTLGATIVAILALQQQAVSADAPALSARISYRDNYPVNSVKRQVVLRGVRTQYRADRLWAPGNDPGPQLLDELHFRVTVVQPRPATQWIGIPLAAIDSIDFQWLPFPRSMAGFKYMQIRMKDGGSHVVEMIVDAHEYRYRRTAKDGVTQLEITGDVEMYSPGSVSAMRSGSGIRVDIPYEWQGFRGNGPERQWPSSKDTDWRIDQGLVDHVEFLLENPAKRP